MKRKFLNLSALALILVTSGCVTTPQGGKQLDPQLAKQLAYDAAFISASYLKPQYGAELGLTYEALNTFVAAGSQDPVQLHNALQNLPVASLQGTNGAVLLDGASLALQTATGYLLSLDKKGVSQAYVLPVAIGLRDGLKAGLGR